MKYAPVLLIFLLVGGCSRPAAEPAPVMRHLLIVSIDGLRPDLLLRAEAPNVRGLMARGSFTMWAHTTDVAVTLPSHTSMLTGTVPYRHEVWWNYDMPEQYVQYPPVPSVLDLAKKAGYTTAMAVGKSKLRALARPGSLDWCYLPDGYANDLNVARQAEYIITHHQPQLMFVHFADNDAVGHGSGWGSPEQIRTIQTADAAVGIVLDALRRAGILESTVIILNADHGGSGYGHGPDDERSNHIPWIICGPGIRKNVDLTTERELVVRVEDTFATACFLLKIPLDEDIDGKPITQALEAIKIPEDEPPANLAKNKPKPSVPPAETVTGSAWGSGASKP